MPNRAPSYRVSDCCRADCLHDSESEPCWGTVVCEEYDEFDSYWVHACEGHVYYYDGDCKYITEIVDHRFR